MAPEVRRGGRGRQAGGRAAVREPGAGRGRLLRRRHRGRDPRQAHVTEGPARHRSRKLDALQEDHEDAEADRRGAEGHLSPERHGALGQERGQEPGAREPRAGGRDRPGDSGLEMAAALRRRADRRLPGPVGHCYAGRAGAGHGPRGRGREAALGEAHAEPRGVRRLLEGRGDLERHGRERSAQGAQGAGLLRAGRGPRSRLRAGVGENLAGEFDLVRQRRSHARARGACPSGGGEGGRAGARPAGALPGLRLLRTVRPPRLRPRPGAVREGAPVWRPGTRIS